MKAESELFKNLNIHLENNIFQYTNEKSEEDCKIQIKNIIEFQQRIMGYKENIVPRFSSTIGRDIEGFKVSLKKLRRIINNLDSKSKSKLALYMMSLERDIIKQAEGSIELSTSEGYYDIIKRSMNRYEICIGRGDRGNLNIIDGDIFIATTKYMSYNLIENDIYAYLKRLRKKRIDIKMSNLIEFFVKESNLDDKSIKYIKGLIIYPYEELKIVQRYFNKKLDLSDEEIIDLIEGERRVNKIILEDLGGIK